ncbi:hypothetical protein J6590_036297 [Homalodisca vitripennis]|nr:hypothetical protein J6590_036297 [Homalodisca vitripennis]
MRALNEGISDLWKLLVARNLISGFCCMWKHPLSNPLPQETLDPWKIPSSSDIDTKMFTATRSYQLSQVTGFGTSNLLEMKILANIPSNVDYPHQWIRKVYVDSAMIPWNLPFVIALNARKHLHDPIYVSNINGSKNLPKHPLPPLTTSHIPYMISVTVDSETETTPHHSTFDPITVGDYSCTQIVTSIYLMYVTNISGAECMCI